LHDGITSFSVSNKYERNGAWVYDSLYTQAPLRSYLFETEKEVMPSCNQFSFDDVPVEDESPICIDCYHDLDFDGFNNYHCTGCGGWFAESEITHYNKF